MSTTRLQKRAKLLEPVIDENAKILVQFSGEEGAEITSTLHIPLYSTPKQLTVLLNELLSNSDPLPYSFFVEEKEVLSNLGELGMTKEERITITYMPQAVFRVRSVTRCSTTLSGHGEAVLSCVFSPDGRSLASASGDTTVRVWNLRTETPKHTLKGHTNWVQHVAWSPDCKLLVSAGMDSTLRVWDPEKGGEAIGIMKAHTQPITALCFEPMHLNMNCNRMASASKDGTVRVWDVILRKVLFTLAQHTAPVMCLRWSGDGVIYTGSRDKTIKMWDSSSGKLIKSLDGHAHWVNSLALSSDFILRTGPYDHTDPKFANREEAHAAALKRYKEFMGEETETLASASDDFTIIIWKPRDSKKAVARMTGHQQPVNHIAFSPDGRKLASASFDKSIKLWDAKDGLFLSTLRGHVGACYQVAFSSDSRKLTSCSRDSTCKVWDLAKGKLLHDLPGHSDEVFTCDWSPSGDCLASGGKDKTLKIWKH